MFEDDELNDKYADEQADILSNHILALMGAKTTPSHDADRMYENLTEIMVRVMGKVRKKVQPLDQYPYTWDMFAENLGLISNDLEGKYEKLFGYSVFHVEHSSVHCIQKSD